MKIITTLRSGELIDIPAHGVESSGKKVYHPPHFPHCLHSLYKEKQHVEIFETFKQVRINILLLDTIKSIVAYAKFHSKSCTRILGHLLLFIITHHTI